MTRRIPLFQVISGGKLAPTAHEPTIGNFRNRPRRTESQQRLFERESRGLPHNGWSNYPTWLVYYSVAGEDVIYRHWLREAARFREAAVNQSQSCKHDVAGQIKYATLLSTELCRAFYGTPLESKFGVHSELLMLALEKVDWQNLATELRKESAEDFPHTAKQPVPNSLTDGRIRFRAGYVTVSPGVLKILSHKALVDAVICHQRGDWGLVDAKQLEANEAAMNGKGCLVSVYRTRPQVEYWLVTDSHRGETTVRLPSEY